MHVGIVINYFISKQVRGDHNRQNLLGRNDGEDNIYTISERDSN
jgi:hypothetical protein